MARASMLLALFMLRLATALDMDPMQIAEAAGDAAKKALKLKVEGKPKHAHHKKDKEEAVAPKKEEKASSVGGKHIKVNFKAGTESCAPPKGILTMKPSKPAGELPKFFLHEEFGDAEGVMNCFYKAKNSTAGVDDFDFKLMPDTAEHMVDIWMLQQLRNHPSRTRQAAEAKLHIVGFPIFNSYAGGRFWKCGSHEDRISSLVEKMTNNKFYKKSMGKNFVIIATAPDAKRVFTPPLIELATAGRVIVATADKNYPSVEPFKLKAVIPYKGMHPIENNLFAENKNGSIPLAAERKVNFMFHGDVQKGKRSVLKVINEGLESSDIQDHDFEHMGMQGFKKVVENSVASYRNSKFCLVVEGSTPTSRRLFDAMASGCVPILIGGEAGIKRNLAFQRSIDWSNIVYYGGDLDCVGKNYVGTQNFLKEFLRIPEKEIDERRMRGVQAFKESLSYKSPGVVSGLLLELEEVVDGARKMKLKQE